MFPAVIHKSHKAVSRRFLLPETPSVTTSQDIETWDTARFEEWHLANSDAFHPLISEFTLPNTIHVDGIWMVWCDKRFL
jgi:hypothetical protein